jgi:creatinine amidohydrolase
MGGWLWEDLTGPEITAALAGRPDEVGLLPVGAAEQHGPHLPTGTDTVIATKLAEAVSARTGAPVLPSINASCSFGHGRMLGGTLSLTPEVLAGAVRAIADWAACSGLRRMLVVNAHMGNAAALGVAGDHLRLERPDLRFGVIHWWQASADVAAETSLDGEDIHANRAETALMLALAPESVRARLVAGADDEDRTRGLVFRYTADSLSTNGVTGRPSEATAALGERLLSLTVDALCDMVERGRTEEPPLIAHGRNPRTISMTQAGGQRC